MVGNPDSFLKQKRLAILSDTEAHFSTFYGNDDAVGKDLFYLDSGRHHVTFLEGSVVDSNKTRRWVRTVGMERHPEFRG